MTTVSTSLVARPITLEQLAALSDEIAALARAGVPIDRGLAELAHEMPGRLGKMAGEIGQRLAEGRPLEQVVAELGSSLPPAYCSVIAAGVRSGRLSAAVEGISQTARRIGQLRNAIFLSLLYPLVVLLLTWLLAMLVLAKLGPVFARMLVEFDVTGPWIVDAYDAAQRHVAWIGPLVPLAFGAWLAWAWYRAGRLAAGLELHPLLSFGAVRTLGRMQRASRLAALADLLALLVENSVPLPEAVELASTAVGSPAIATGGTELAERMRRGETVESVTGFPSLVAWALTCGQSQPRLLRSLARIADVYREEASRRSAWLAAYVPLFLVIFVCGGFVFCYALMTLGPWIFLMKRLALPY